MSRLKIVDHSDIPVPFRFPHLGIVIAFNGEVYNWRELRAELVAPWTTSCDVEVFAAAYRAWGINKALNATNGMFSFVLIDTTQGTMHVGRDRFGQKPLFYATHGEHLYIASEAKGLPIELVPGPSVDMETLEYDVREETPLRGVSRLAPGHRFELTRLVQPTPAKWYDLPDASARLATGHMNSLTDELEDLLLDAVRLRAIAEVPVALQFSGGLDSTLIRTATRRLGLQLDAYCVTMDEIDHLAVARRAAPGASITPVRVNKDAFFSALSDVVYHLDTPATWTAVCLWLLNERIAQDDHRVVLSGEGADELFLGYTRYRALFWLEQALADPLLSAYQPLITRALQDPEDACALLLDRGDNALTRAHARAWIQTFGGQEPHAAARLGRTELATTLQVLLRMGDRTASAHSLENRCPFLDYRIVEFALRTPVDCLVTQRESKAILRHLGRRWALASSVVSEKTKRGLAVPWNLWDPSHAVEGLGQGSARGAWDRRSFASLMQQTWRDSLVSRHQPCPKLAPKSR